MDHRADCCAPDSPPCLVQADAEFVTLLAAIRGGACSRAQLDDLQRRCGRELDVSDGILPTRVRTMSQTAVFHLGCLSLPAVWMLLHDAQNLARYQCGAAHVFINKTLTGPPILGYRGFFMAHLECKPGPEYLLARASVSAHAGPVSAAR